MSRIYEQICVCVNYTTSWKAWCCNIVCGWSGCPYVEILLCWVFSIILQSCMGIVLDALVCLLCASLGQDQVFWGPWVYFPYLICSWSSLHILWILPFGMWFMFVCRKILVSVVLAMCKLLVKFCGYSEFCLWLCHIFMHIF